MSESEEKALAQLAASIKLMDDTLYTPMTVAQRAMCARYRKAQFDAHVKAGFTEIQALTIVSRLI